MNLNRIALIAVAGLVSATTALAQGNPERSRRETGFQQRAETPQAQSTEEKKPEHHLLPPVEKSSVTHHSARIGGQEINYTATAGTYVIKDDQGNPKATFFYVAYTKDGVPDASKRPVSFVYNGGPGSASLFTHMGMGPERVVLTPDGHGMPAPYTITDNEDSFLDATDLVFVDADFDRL